MTNHARISPLLTIAVILAFGFLAVSLAAPAGHSQALQLPSDRPVSFTNATTGQGDDPHAYGVGIELYKHGAWTGFIWEFEGPVADPPVGRLDGLQLDEHAGTLVFTAKLSLGVTQLPGTREWVVPTKDLFEFSGTIKQDAVSGELVRRLVDDAARRSTTEMLVLKREVGERGSTDTSYDDWNRNWELRMKIRGPK